MRAICGCGRVRTYWWLGTLVALIVVLWLLGPIITPFAVDVRWWATSSIRSRQGWSASASRASSPPLVLIITMMTLIAATVIVVVPVLLTEANDLIRAIPDQYEDGAPRIDPDHAGRHHRRVGRCGIGCGRGGA